MGPAFLEPYMLTLGLMPDGGAITPRHSLYGMISDDGIWCGHYGHYHSDPRHSIDVGSLGAASSRAFSLHY